MLARCALAALLLTGCASTPTNGTPDLWDRGAPDAANIFSLASAAEPLRPEVLARGMYYGHGGWDTMPLPPYCRRVDVYPQQGGDLDTLWISAEDDYDGSYIVAVGIPYTVAVAGFKQARIRATYGTRWRIEVTR